MRGSLKHARFYAEFSAKAAAHYYGAEQLVWVRRINRERDNNRAALVTAIDTANAAIAVQLVANHPHHHGYAGTNKVFDVQMPPSRVLGLPNASEVAGYDRVLMVAAWQAYLTRRPRPRA